MASILKRILSLLAILICVVILGRSIFKTYGNSTSTQLKKNNKSVYVKQLNKKIQLSYPFEVFGKYAIDNLNKLELVSSLAEIKLVLNDKNYSFKSITDYYLSNRENKSLNFINNRSENIIDNKYICFSLPNGENDILVDDKKLFLCLNNQNEYYPRYKLYHNEQNVFIYLKQQDKRGIYKTNLTFKTEKTLEFENEKYENVQIDNENYMITVKEGGKEFYKLKDLIALDNNVEYEQSSLCGLYNPLCQFFSNNSKNIFADKFFNLDDKNFNEPKRNFINYDSNYKFMKYRILGEHKKHINFYEIFYAQNIMESDKRDLYILKSIDNGNFLIRINAIYWEMYV